MSENLKYNIDDSRYPKMTGNINTDVKILSKLSSNDLIIMCEYDKYVFNLCSNNIELYNRIIKPNPLS